MPPRGCPDLPPTSRVEGSCPSSYAGRHCCGPPGVPGPRPLLQQRSSLCPRTPSRPHGISVVPQLRTLRAGTLSPLFLVWCPGRSQEGWPGVLQDVPRLRSSHQGSLLPTRLLPVDAGPVSWPAVLVGPHHPREKGSLCAAHAGGPTSTHLLPGAIPLLQPRSGPLPTCVHSCCDCFTFRKQVHPSGPPGAASLMASGALVTVTRLAGDLWEGKKERRCDSRRILAKTDGRQYPDLPWQPAGVRAPCGLRGPSTQLPWPSLPPLGPQLPWKVAESPGGPGGQRAGLTVSRARPPIAHSAPPPHPLAPWAAALTCAAAGHPKQCRGVPFPLGGWCGSPAPVPMLWTFIHLPRPLPACAGPASHCLVSSPGLV